MSVIYATEREFNDLIKEGIVLVDFYADWCGPCKMLAPVLDSIGDQRGNDIKIIKINVDKNESLAQSFGVLSIPTLVLYKNGKIVDKRMGFMPAEMLNEWIDSAR